MEETLKNHLSEIIWADLKSADLMILQKELVKYRRVLNLATMLKPDRLIEIWYEFGQRPPNYLQLEKNYERKKGEQQKERQ